jgi:hypothetical protein
MIALAPLVLQLIQLGLSVAPELISAAMSEISIFNSGTAPTAAQQADLDSAMASAHAALQGAQPAAG